MYRALFMKGTAIFFLNVAYVTPQEHLARQLSFFKRNRNSRLAELLL